MTPQKMARCHAGEWNRQRRLCSLQVEGERGGKRRQVSLLLYVFRVACKTYIGRGRLGLENSLYVPLVLWFLEVVSDFN